MAAHAADAERLKRVNTLLEEALELPEDEREDWLAALPPQHHDLRPMLRAMLSRAEVETDTFLAQPLRVALAELPDPEAENEVDRAGDTIGPYRLVREIGAGGMANVWIAERIDGSLQRQEALKLPRAGWAMGLARRMARERDILAALEHPRIARLYDAGITPAGRPWLAMELVDGVPIDEHCRAHALSVEQRLRLVLQVADAVAHAHARLVVHRDLKPSNILVTAGGDVRLLDFGVAKLLEDDAAPASNLTQLLGRAVTPDYAAPEQLSGRPVGVGADVYSLGVVLYELLCGQRPYRLRRESIAALEEAVVSADVPPPSSRVEGDRRLARALRGDLDTIVAKALKKDPAERYPSVEALAADLERHLNGEPVRARPDGAGYRARKFLQRHRWGVGATAAFTALLAVALGVSLWQARAIERERDRADVELKQSQAAMEFFNTLLTEHASQEQTAVLRALIDKGEAVAGEIFRGEPAKEALALMMLAEYHGHFGNMATLEPLMRHAAQRAAVAGDLDLQANIECVLGRTLTESGRPAEAAVLLERWLARDDIDPETRAGCHAGRGYLARQSSDAAGALRHAQGAYDNLRRVRQPPVWLQADIESDLGHALILNGRYDEAETRLDSALQRLDALGRSDGTSGHNVRIRLARLNFGAGTPQRGVALLEEVAQAYRRIAGPEEPLPPVVVDNLALGHELAGDLDAAARRYADTLAVARASGNQALVVSGLVGQASVQAQRGDLPGARALLAQAEAAMADKVPPGNPADLRRRLALGRVQLAGGDPATARATAAGLLALLDERGLVDANRIGALCLQGEAALAAGDRAGARTALDDCLALAQRLQGRRAHSLHTGLAWRALAALERADANPGAAAADAAKAAEHVAATAAPGHPARAAR
ncbi:MAG: protein kinase [Piscinibacter sp.]|nr:protein kinase [Piscinibacter sp.]